MSLELQEEICTGHKGLRIMNEPIIVKAKVPRNSLWKTLGVHLVDSRLSEALMAGECLGGRDGALGC